MSLHAEDPDTDSGISLVVQGADVLGSMRRGDSVYNVRPLGDGRTVMYRYDTSRLRRHPPGWGWRMQRSAPPPKARTPASGVNADTGDVIDLMVAYTPAARTAAGNIHTFIRMAIDNTHRIYRNSNIGFRLRLVHTQRVDYTEHSKLREDLNRLGRPEDGFMDELHGLRDRYGADLVALIVGREANRACGVAWATDFGKLPDRDWSHLGFSVTAHNCETSDFHTFAHELGHNRGPPRSRQFVQTPTSTDMHPFSPADLSLPLRPLQHR